MSKPEPTPEQQMKRISRRSFAWAGLALIGVYKFFGWLNDISGLKARTLANNDPAWAPSEPFKRSMEFNANVNRTFYNGGKSPEFQNVALGDRINSDIGMEDELVPDDWQLKVYGLQSKPELILNLADIKKLPRTEMTTEFKCIEGWSQYVRWAGVSIPEFLKAYPLAAKANYIALETPDGGYYVSIDMAAAMHPQTLLCYEMNGAPLTDDHGAPLRLVIPHKYGIKNIKRIGTIRFVTARPKDYWAEQGYDWYAGL